MPPFDVELPGLRSLEVRAGTQLAVIATDSQASHLRLSSSDAGPIGIRMEVALRDAVGYWHPTVDAGRTLPADWAGQSTTSLVQSAPLGVLHDSASRALFGWAAGEPVNELSVRYGVSEEHKSFVIDISATTPGNIEIRLDAAHSSLPTMAGQLTGWISGQIAEPTLVVPRMARLPVYSTWYTFTQDVSAAVIEAEAVVAAQLGCGSVFIDDGWQELAHGRGYQGLGDWLPDESKFPDLAAHVHRLHDLGLGVALWIAPLFLGAQSKATSRLDQFAPHLDIGAKARILDPRYAQVREHIADVCVRLVTHYKLDGLKVDFLDTAMAYEGTASPGDIADVGVAMAAMLGLVRRRFDDLGLPDVIFEFRQPYVSPAIARYGQILRASDCPADAVRNRQRVIDARLVSAGQVVHSDPLMWDPEGGVAAVAQQIYAALLSVPQISMSLPSLAADQQAAVAGLLDLWRTHADVLLDGRLGITGSEVCFTSASATRADLDRAVVVAYAPVVVDLDQFDVSDVTVINATSVPGIVVRTRRSMARAEYRDGAGALVSAPVDPEDASLSELGVLAWGSVRLTLG